MNDDRPTQDDTPLVLPDPGATTEPKRQEPWLRIDGPGQISLGIMAGLLVGGIVAVFGIGLVLAPGRESRTMALIYAAAELAATALLSIRAFRRPHPGFLRGFLIGFSVALLLSSMCYGAIGLGG